MDTEINARANWAASQDKTIADQAAEIARLRGIMSKYRCKVCEQTLESKHRHDFAVCACGNGLDGGDECTRIVGRKGSTKCELECIDDGDES